MIRIAIVALLLQVCGLPALAAPYLWEVSSLSNKIYLFGTIHAGKKEWFPLDRVVEEAFQDSRVLVVEADILDADKLAESAKAMTYPEGDTLAKHVSEFDYARFVKILARFSATEDTVARMKPFMAVSFLVFGEWARAGYDPAYGVDAYLLKKAKAEVKPIVELEGVEAQVALMDSLTDDENNAIFEGTLSALESGLTREQIDDMVAAWREGDPAKMLKTAQKYNDNVKGAREFEERFVWSRHEPMLRKLEFFLNDSRDRAFVAVGALHLAGPRGLVELLRRKGYIVKQVGAASAGTGFQGETK
jgi:uncharacterized protein YbaP (TraB family)